MSFTRIGVSENKNTFNTCQTSKKDKKEAKAKSSMPQEQQKGLSKNKNQYEDSQTINGIEQFENYKKMVKIEKKNQSAIEISKILNKGSLRQRFERLQNIKTIQQMMNIPKYQQFCKMFFYLNTILINQTLAFQEIVIQFKQDYQIEFKVQFLQQYLSIWSDSFYLAWKYYDKDKLNLEVGIKDQQFNDNEEKGIVFQQKLLDYIQRKGEYIELYPLPKMNNISQNNNIYEQEQQTINVVDITSTQQQHQQNNNQLRCIAISLQNYFHLRDVSNIYLINIEKYLIKQEIDLNQNNGILSIINQLVSKYSEWITLIQGQRDQIVRINRCIDIKQLMLEYECLDCN